MDDGGSCILLKARDLDWKRDVALKIVNDPFEHVLSEFKIHYGLKNCPHVSKVYSLIVTKAKTCPIIISEYLPDFENLQDVIISKEKRQIL